MTYYQPTSPSWGAQPTPEAPSSDRVPFHQRGWVRAAAVGVAAFLLGTGVGASTSDVTASPEYQKIEKSKDQWRAQAVSSEARVDAIEGKLETATGQVAAAKKSATDTAKTAADAQAMKVAATAAKKKADRRLQKLDAREASLDARETKIEDRESTQPAAVTDDGDDGDDSSGGTDPHFGTCGEANDNGYGPYTSGMDEEYDWYIDRDGDGTVCEF